MSIVYDLFAGNATGGSIDYTTVILTTASLSAALPALATGSRTLFGVRARDTVTGLSDGNTDATVLIVVGSDGSDQTSAPRPPVGLRAFAGPGGAATVEWAWPYRGFPPPTGFHVYLGTPSPAYGSIAATALYASTTPGQVACSVTLTGLSDGVAYQIGVRAYNATGEERNTSVASVTGRSAPPPALSSLTVAPTY